MRHVKCISVDVNGILQITDLGDGPFDVTIKGEFINYTFEDIKSIEFDDKQAKPPTPRANPQSSLERIGVM